MRRNWILGLFILAMIASACAQRSAGVAGDGTFDPDLIGSNPDEFEDPERSTIWDLFRANTQEQTINVNKYIWAASLDVLQFLPVQTVDPFSGVIVTGFGTPPGGGRAYRATVHITDPALEARALRVALQSRNGPVSAATARAVEDAILSRARQLRIADNNL
ncbi:MAG: DUF3576 domain-containing protein [Pseudomonadota bacterium]